MPANTTSDKPTGTTPEDLAAINERVGSHRSALDYLDVAQPAGSGGMRPVGAGKAPKLVRGS